MALFTRPSRQMRPKLLLLCVQVTPSVGALRAIRALRPACAPAVVLRRLPAILLSGVQAVGPFRFCHPSSRSAILAPLPRPWTTAIAKALPSTGWTSGSPTRVKPTERATELCLQPSRYFDDSPLKIMALLRSVRGATHAPVNS